MKMNTITAAALCALMMSPMGAHAVQISNFDTLTQKQIESSYFFDWNRNSTFRGSLFKAFKSSGIPMPVWLLKGGGGAAPAQVVHSGNTHFVLLDTCAPGDCRNNMVYVLFDPATKTTAAVSKLNKKIAWVGKPNNVAKQILSNASGLR